MRASQCVVYSRKRGTWHVKWFEDGKPHRRQLGTIRELPSRAAAEKPAEPFRRMLAKPIKVVRIVSILVEQFFLVAIDPELIELFRFSVTLLGDVALGEREDGEEHAAENHTGDGGFVLGQ